MATLDLASPDPAAYDVLPDGVVVAGPDGRVLVLNAAAARMLSTTPEAALGKDFHDVMPLVDDQGRDWWKCTDPYGGLSTRSRQPEVSLSPPAGGDVLVTASYVRDEQRRLVRLVVCLRDTRARERLERGRANLVSTVAHELRSPLTSVKGFTATLLSRWDRFTDEHKQLMLRTVNADADRVTRLITELLDVSRIDAGRLEVKKQVVDLGASIAKVVEGRIAAGEPRERFVLVVEGGLPEMWVDPDKFQQIVANLVENALRHGAGTITVCLRPAEVKGGRGAAVTVADEGTGIPDEVLNRIFVRFWRGDRQSGTGLGLYIVKGLVEAHGGQIEVVNGDGGGAVFRFVLPAGTPEAFLDD